MSPILVKDSCRSIDYLTSNEIEKNVDSNLLPFSGIVRIPVQIESASWFDHNTTHRIQMSVVLGGILVVRHFFGTV